MKLIRLSSCGRGRKGGGEEGEGGRGGRGGRREGREGREGRRGRRRGRKGRRREMEEGRRGVRNTLLRRSAWKAVGCLLHRRSQPVALLRMKDGWVKAQNS